MKVCPINRFTDSPVSLCLPGHRSMVVMTENGSHSYRGADACYQALDALADHVVYVTGSPSNVRHTTGAGYWEGRTWRGKTVRMNLDGTATSVISLRGTLDSARTPFNDLMIGIQWLRERNVGPASLSQMGWSLWRSTLTRSLKIWSPPAVGRSALYGGRQEVREPNRTYRHMVAADITAAYPHSMACRPYPLGLRLVSSSTVLDPSAAGIVRGRVSVPDDMPYGPLPMRLGPDMIQFGRGVWRGTWSWAEAAAAVALGVDLRIDKCWAPTNELDLFGDWWTLVQEGRELPGAAGKLVKGVANSLWGLFGMRGDDRGTVRWMDGAGLQPVRVNLAASNLPHAGGAHLAAETSSRVRVRILSESLYGRSQSPVHIDTDGVIVRRRNDLTLGDQPGEWRIKQPMRKVEVKAPQVYRYECGKGCGVVHPAWHYVAAGVPPEMAPGVFDDVGTLGTYHRSGLDVVLPSTNSLDKKRIEAHKK